MRKSAILEEAHIHDEPEDVGHSSKAKPKLSYSQALQSYFIAEDGAIHQVETCPVWAIQELINSAIQTTKNPQACVISLAGLDYRDKLDRWYGLIELLRQRATVPLYTTAEDAEKAQKQRQSASKVV